jgi:hypothetical protein
MMKKITVTKIASAYVELEEDLPVSIGVDQIENLIAISKNEGIGASIIFLHDGTSVNVVETCYEIRKRIGLRNCRDFQYLFGMN